MSKKENESQHRTKMKKVFDDKCQKMIDACELWMINFMNILWCCLDVLDFTFGSASNCFFLLNAVCKCYKVKIDGSLF